MICFIILHYMVKEQTIECVDSVLNLVGEKKVIIVDNASANGSGRELKEYYKDLDDVVVLLNKENLGFAGGNNIGCKFAQQEYHPEYYVVMNNDVIIKQKDFIERIYSIDKEEHFDALGPDIYAVRNKRHQNPKSLQPMTIEKARKLQKHIKKRMQRNILTHIKSCLKQNAVIYGVYSKLIKRDKPIDWTCKYHDVMLQGACFIFSDRFIEKRNEAFFPNTFLWFEAQILSYECKINGFHTLYDPSLQVFHYENVSTRSEHKKNKDREKYMLQQSYNSVSAFLAAYDK